MYRILKIRLKVYQDSLSSTKLNHYQNYWMLKGACSQERVKISLGLTELKKLSFEKYWWIALWIMDKCSFEMIWGYIILNVQSYRFCWLIFDYFFYRSICWILWIFWWSCQQTHVWNIYLIYYILFNILSCLVYPRFILYLGFNLALFNSQAIKFAGRFTITH